LQTPENGSIETPIIETAQAPSLPPRAVAPLWHTVILIAAIVALSMQGASQFSGKQADPPRMGTYALTAASELLMLGWVFFGLRLRKIPFRSLLGSVSNDFRSIAIDLGFAMAFWIGSLIVLGTIGIFWTVIEALIKHQPLLQPGKHPAPDTSQQQAVHALTALVPTNGHEVAAWVLICVVAGLAEEIIFRGYFQRQFTAWSRGTIAVGVVFSALLFGSAHGYQGVRNMVMLTIFGVLFSLLALFRRSLRAGIIAHAWHDCIAGLTLALLKMHHLI
jgi:membrane protease YdiL (CAAX protease family)